MTAHETFGILTFVVNRSSVPSFRPHGSKHGGWKRKLQRKLWQNKKGKAMPKINFRAADTAFKPAENGSYLVEVEKMQLKKSSAGNDMIEAEFKILTPMPEGYGTKLFDNFSLLPQSGWKLKNFMEAAEVPYTVIALQEKGSFDVSFDTDDTIGARLIVRVEQETFQSKTKKNSDGSPMMDIRAKVVEYLKV